MESYYVIDAESDWRHKIVGKYATYDQALTVHGHLLKVTDAPVSRFYVRSEDDPIVRKLETAGRYVSHDVEREAIKAANEFLRKEIGATARWAIDLASEGTSLQGVINLVYRSIVAKGYEIAVFQAQDAVKARVLIGRASDGTHSGRGKGYWMKKSEGPLSQRHAPNGDWLCQSSLSLQDGFYRLPARAA